MSLDHQEILNRIASKPENQKNYCYKYILFFSMFCMILMLCNYIFIYRLVVLVGFIHKVINIKLITGLKFLMSGKYFWLRNIGASGVGEVLYSILATSIIQYGKLSWSIIISIIIASATLKIVYTVLLAFPAQIIAVLVGKSEENLDAGHVKISSRGLFCEHNN